MDVIDILKDCKEILEGELLTYHYYPPKNDIEIMHKRDVEECVDNINSYLGNLNP